LLLLLANFGKEDKPEPMCPCGCGPMTMICEDVSERLDVVPAQFRVLVTRRPKNGCRRCSGAVAQAHAPEHAWWAADRGADRLGDHRKVWR